MSVLKVRNIMIRSQGNGEIDYDDLHETIRINRDVPAIVMANIGTTMKGAIDDVAKIRGILSDLAVTKSYLHADAALSGMILPFVDDPQPFGFDAGFDSVSISGHKMVGCPLPCGVALTRREYVSRIARAIEYVGVLDTTLTGSRNALTPLMMWYAFEQKGLDGFRAHRERMPRDGGIRGCALQRRRHPRVAQQELGHRRVPEADGGCRAQVAARALRGHRAPHRDAARHTRDRRRRGGRLRAWNGGSERRTGGNRMSRIVVIANNESGVIADIAGALAERNINIETISAEALGEKGAITHTTDDHDGALRALTDAGFKTVSDESLILRLQRRAGRAGQAGGQVQAGRREYSEPALSGPPKRLRHGRHIRRRSRQGGSRWWSRRRSCRWEEAGRNFAQQGKRPDPPITSLSIHRSTVR